MIADDNSDVTLSDESDTAYIQGNNSTVRGALGHDRLAALLNDLRPEAVATTLWGGEGNDTLHAALSTRFEPDEGSAVTAALNGGSGDDEIEILASSGGFSDQSLTASGGAGADTISIESGYLPEDDPYHSVNVQVDGGDDADVIDVDITWASAGRTIIDGGEGGDSIRANGLYNEVRGGTGNDDISVIARETADWSNDPANYVEGGDGSDTISMQVSGWGSPNTGYGGDGDDEMTLEARGFLAANIAYGDAGDDTMTLTADGTYWAERASASNEAHGGEGNDSISASITLETVSFDDEWTLLPLSGTNTVFGDAGDDRLIGSVSVDDPSELEFAYSELSGGSGDDYVKASGGFGNILYGNTGDDSLYGSGNEDRLIGGGGADFLRGNGGSDSFEFWGARGLSAKERDRIDDFTIGEDLIDASRIDANAYRNGNQAFRFSSEGEWQGTGRIWVEDNPDNDGSIVYASTGRKMLAINLLDGASVDASDYSASDFIL